MKKKSKFICLCLCIAAALFFVLSVQGQGEENHTHGTAIGTEQEFLQMQSGGTYYLANDLTVSETLTVNTEVTLCLNGNILEYRNAEKNGSIFRITENGTLNIYDCSEKKRFCEVSENGLWVLSEGTSEDEFSDEEKDGLKTVYGGLIIGGTGEIREIGELEASYFCGGFAYAESGTVRDIRR